MRPWRLHRRLADRLRTYGKGRYGPAPCLTVATWRILPPTGPAFVSALSLRPTRRPRRRRLQGSEALPRPHRADCVHEPRPPRGSCPRSRGLARTACFRRPDAQTRPRPGCARRPRPLRMMPACGDHFVALGPDGQTDRDCAPGRAWVRDRAMDLEHDPHASWPAAQCAEFRHDRNPRRGGARSRGMLARFPAVLGIEDPEIDRAVYGRPLAVSPSLSSEPS